MQNLRPGGTRNAPFHEGKAPKMHVANEKLHDLQKDPKDDQKMFTFGGTNGAQNVAWSGVRH